MPWVRAASERHRDGGPDRRYQQARHPDGVHAYQRQAKVGTEIGPISRNRRARDRLARRLPLSGSNTLAIGHVHTVREDQVRQPDNHRDHDLGHVRRNEIFENKKDLERDIPGL